ncbi:MAG: M28 family peptidase [Gemmatimonadaceae bacterium]
MTIRFAHLAAGLAVMALAAGKVQAQNALPLKFTGKPTVPAITAADAMTRLYIFADDSMLGRDAAGPGAVKGTAYIEREVRRMGLVPAGDNGTFFQAIPLYIRTLDMQSRLVADTDALVAGVDYVPIHPGGSPRPLDGVQVIFAGKTPDAGAMIPPELAVGKAVAFSGSPTGMARRYPGAVAFILIRPDATIAQARRFGLQPATGMQSENDLVRTPLTLIVPVSKASKLLGVPFENARPGTIGRTLHGDARYSVATTSARNVVAILPGSDPKLKNEYVAIGAHSDHIGLRDSGPVNSDSLRAYNDLAARIYIGRTGEIPGFPGSGLTPAERARVIVNTDSLRRLRPARLDSIYNGADDDGSGTVGVLEIAEKFAAAKVKPKRSLLFVWHTGEELGLYGSEYFTDHPSIPRDSIVAQLNIDMIGRGEASDLPGGGADYLQLLGSRRLSSEFGNLIEAINDSSTAPFRIDYTFDAAGHPEQYYCRSDHYEYARYGIPIVFMSTGGHIDYHQLTDEPQFINYTHLAKVANFLATTAERVANLNHRFVVDGQKPDPKAECVQ